MKTVLTAQISALKRLLEMLSDDVVLKNSLYLMASTAVMGGFGFVFWLISARLYTPEQIGLASTLIASATTLSLFSLLGFDNVLVRFLPGSKHPDRVIDTSIIFTSIGAVTLAVGFLLTLPVISPSLHQLLANPWMSVFFVLTIWLVTINTLTDSIFVAFQAAKYVLVADTGLSIVKIALPVMLVALGSLGIFAGYAVAVTTATIISLAVLARRYRYAFRPLIYRETIEEVKRFSAGTYIANLAGAVPSMVLPIMATNALGAEPAAYFNLAMTVAALLFIVPKATSNSLFAEGSKDSAKFWTQYLRTLRQTAYILLPALVVIVVFGRPMLSVFGPQYATGSFGPLVILVMSAVSLSFSSIASTVLKLKHRLQALIFIEITGSALMLVSAWPLMSLFGVNGAAGAWLLGQTVMAVLLAFTLLPLPKPKAARDTV